MSKIRSRDTKLEAALFLLLSETGIRFRKYPKGIYGNPDAANKSKKLAIFVDGDFWHGYNWKQRRDSIGTNREYWIKKIERNIARDREVNRTLKKEGWRVFRIWGFELKKKNLKRTLRKMQRIAV